MSSALARLRVHAVSQTSFLEASVDRAIARLGFVQADPIRSPATAQDLILRHRVAGYKSGDLERSYPALDLDEDYLYAYGYLPRPVGRLLHPRRATALEPMEKRVLEAVRELGQVHPRELEARLGRERVVNAWGGHSKATTRSLETLHYRGLLRIARREKGIRVYELPGPALSKVTPEERLRSLAMAVAGLLAPVSTRTLGAIAASLARSILGRAVRSSVTQELLASGALHKRSVDDIDYVWPASSLATDEAPRVTRFLAPFDPIVWDRRRFEHLWGWPYRFEAYTPVAKRVRGYYAMPLLWGDRVIGWANASFSDGRLDVELGFAGKRPRERAFREEVDAEIARLEAFLG